MKTHYTIPFFIPHEGCPFACIFCSQKRITGKIKSVKPEDMAPQISRYLKTIPQDKACHIEVGFFGGSFTGIPIKKQKAFLEKTQPLLLEGKIHGIRLSTRPDFISQHILDILKEYGVSCIELGVQSASDRVLKISKRGHTLRAIKKSSALILKNGFRLGHQIMVGLPGSSLADEMATAGISAKCGASDVRIYPLIVIKKTPLAEMFRKGDYIPLTEREAVQRCAKLIRFFEKKGINVIRCGLHPSENLITGKDILAGPFHPAFRQKVDTYIYGDLFQKHFGKKPYLKIKNISFNPEEAGAIIGHKKENILKLQTILKQNVEFRQDDKIPLGKILLEYNSRKCEFLNKF